MTTEELYQRAAYPQDLPLKIEQMGSIALSVANSWLLGWPEIVTHYFQQAQSQAQAFLNLLETRVSVEKDILANEANLRHSYLAGKYYRYTRSRKLRQDW